MEEAIPPDYITPKITPFSDVEDPKSHLKSFRPLMIISGGLDFFDERCSWAHLEGLLCNGLAGSHTAMPPLSNSSLEYLRRYSQLIKKTPMVA